jgi:hypothetical protein
VSSERESGPVTQSSDDHSLVQTGYTFRNADAQSFVSLPLARPVAEANTADLTSCVKLFAVTRRVGKFRLSHDQIFHHPKGLARHRLVTFTSRMTIVVVKGPFREL